MPDPLPDAGSSSDRGAWRALLAVATLTLLAASPGCNVVDALRDPALEVVEMVPGANVATGGLDCWLTVEIAGPAPEGIDPSDLRVRFRSPALPEPVDFDWAWIADHDVVVDPADAAPGGGHRYATRTRPDAAPPVGERVKVRFPLSTRGIVADAPSPVWLEAELVWGGTAIDRDRRTIEHVYSRLGSRHF
jgi:hypothetical protein